MTPSNPPPKLGAVERSYLDYEYYVWRSRTEPAFIAMTEVAIKAEMNDRLKGKPHDAAVAFVKGGTSSDGATGYYAMIGSGVVWMNDRRKLPARVFDFV